MTFAISLLLPLAVHAQLDCGSATDIARDLVTSAQGALDQNDPEIAANLLEQASILLRQNCIVASVAGNVAVEQTAVPVEPSAEITVLPENPGPTINAPSVDATNSIAYIRFVHTSIDSGSLDIYAQSLGNMLLVQNLQYDQFTDFIFLPSGQHTFVFRPTGSGVEGETMSTLSWNFAQDTSWMVAVAGRVANYSFQIEPFTLLRGQMNNHARVRVVNWVSGTQRITLSSDQGVDFGRGLGWIGIRDIDISPGVYHLTLTTDNGQTPVVSAPHEFAANTHYALLMTGAADGNPLPHLISIPSSQETTRVRFLNNRADSVDIHMRPGSQKLIDALVPGQITDYLSLPNGAATFVAYAPGTGPRGQELSALIEHLRPARDLTIALQPDGSMVVTEQSWTPR